MAGAAEATVRASELRCESCGAPWTMRGFGTTRTVACEHCGNIFDTSGEKWQLVQRVEGAYQTRPRYALGTRGKLDGIEWEIIGWAERSVTAWGTRYAWEEHLLYNPYEGFRYLIYQDGHFIVVESVPGLPKTGVNLARYGGSTFKHFSSADAVVDEVLGEFPWEMRRGDLATATDYVSPPTILSSEESKGEVVWSQGRYLPREEVVAAFGAPSRPLGAPKGVHPCQPNPNKALLSWMLSAAIVGVVVWLLMTMIYLGFRSNEVIWSGKVGPQGLSQEIDIEQGPYEGTVEVSARSQVSNSWVFLPVVLVKQATSRAYFIGLELSYYHGSGWSEGSQSGSTVVGGITQGKYVLQIVPDPKSPYKGQVDVTLRRDVPLYRYPCCALFLLILVPAFTAAQYLGFERSRWADSDHPWS